MASKPSKKWSAQEFLRRQVKREWRGFDDALDLNEGVHLPSEFIAEIIRETACALGGFSRVLHCEGESATIS